MKKESEKNKENETEIEKEKKTNSERVNETKKTKKRSNRNIFFIVFFFSHAPSLFLPLLCAYLLPGISPTVWRLCGPFLQVPL